MRLGRCRAHPISTVGGVPSLDSLLGLCWGSYEHSAPRLCQSDVISEHLLHHGCWSGHSTTLCSELVLEVSNLCLSFSHPVAPAELTQQAGRGCLHYPMPPPQGCSWGRGGGYAFTHVPVSPTFVCSCPSGIHALLCLCPQDTWRLSLVKHRMQCGDRGGGLHP